MVLPLGPIEDGPLGGNGGWRFIPDEDGGGTPFEGPRDVGIVIASDPTTPIGGGGRCMGSSFFTGLNMGRDDGIETGGDDVDLLTCSVSGGLTSFSLSSANTEWMMVFSLSSNCSPRGVVLILLLANPTSSVCSEERLREGGWGGNTKGGSLGPGPGCGVTFAAQDALNERC